MIADEKKWKNPNLPDFSTKCQLGKITLVESPQVLS
jgi:hypothetical protein